MHSVVIAPKTSSQDTQIHTPLIIKHYQQLLRGDVDDERWWDDLLMLEPRSSLLEALLRAYPLSDIRLRLNSLFNKLVRKAASLSDLSSISSTDRTRLANSLLTLQSLYKGLFPSKTGTSQRHDLVTFTSGFESADAVYGSLVATCATLLDQEFSPSLDLLSTIVTLTHSCNSNGLLEYFATSRPLAEALVTRLNHPTHPYHDTTLILAVFVSYRRSETSQCAACRLLKQINDAGPLLRRLAGICIMSAQKVNTLPGHPMNKSGWVGGAWEAIGSAFGVVLGSSPSRPQPKTEVTTIEPSIPSTALIVYELLVGNPSVRPVFWEAIGDQLVDLTMAIAVDTRDPLALASFWLLCLLWKTFLDGGGVVDNRAVDLLESCTFVVRMNMRRHLVTGAYEAALSLVHTLLASMHKRHATIDGFNWKRLWAALVSLLRLLSEEREDGTHIRVPAGRRVCVAALRVINSGVMFDLVQGSTYDDLFYQLLHNRAVFEALGAMSASSSGAPTDDGTEEAVRHSLVNVKAILGHFGPVLAVHAAKLKDVDTPLAPDQIKALIRSNYDKLSLRLMDDIISPEKYREHPDHTPFFVLLCKLIEKG